MLVSMSSQSLIDLMQCNDGDTVFQIFQTYYIYQGYVPLGLDNITINREYHQTSVCDINIACIFLWKHYRKGNIFYRIVQY